MKKVVKSSNDPYYPARFFARGEFMPNGCLEWKGSISSRGRPNKIKFDGKEETPQRVAWMLANGAIPENMRVLHTCRNPLCIRPGHLTLATLEQVMAIHKAETCPLCHCLYTSEEHMAHIA